MDSLIATRAYCHSVDLVESVSINLPFFETFEFIGILVHRNSLEMNFGRCLLMWVRRLINKPFYSKYLPLQSPSSIDLAANLIEKFCSLTAWMQRTIKNWAKTGVNVCAVNWRQLSLEKLNYFFVAQKNTLLVAKYLVDVLQRLEANGVDLKNTTLAGHSLGAQICGKVGSTLKASGKSLGTIFGKYSINSKKFLYRDRVNKVQQLAKTTEFICRK